MKVLVVDDDAVSATLAASVLESLGHQVTTVMDSEQAWGLLVDEPYDVLVSDRQMPGLDGLELCRRLRARSSSSAPSGPADSGYCYVVLLSGHDSDAEALEGLVAGADDYLSKPLNGEELRRRLVVAERVTELQHRLQQQHQELTELGEAQHELARRDALTLLPNRRALQEHLSRLDANARRYSRWFSVAILDVDHFKSYNDVAGHGSGDTALRRIAQAMAGQVRATDGFYRFGGEEFAYVIETDRADAAYAATERLRMAVRALGLPHPARPGETVTVSAGVATSDSSGTTADDLLGAADRALYQAKQAGRDRTHDCPRAETGDSLTTGTTVPPRQEPDPGTPGTAPLLDPAPLTRMHTLGRQIRRNLADEIVETWLRQCKQRLPDLHAALDARDEIALRRQAHVFKGSGATVGAPALAELAGLLEHSDGWPERAQLVSQLERVAGPTNAALVEHLHVLLAT